MHARKARNGRPTSVQRRAAGLLSRLQLRGWCRASGNCQVMARAAEALSVRSVTDRGSLVAVPPSRYGWRRLQVTTGS